MATIDDQLIMHEAAQLCGVLLIRPGMLSGEAEPPAIVGEEVERAVLMARLAPALALAWPDHPGEPEDLAAFLEKAAARLAERSESLAGSEGFVRAARYDNRDLDFEHLRVELTDVAGGVETEDLWESFDAIEATAAIKQLALAGLRIKLRSLGSFLVGSQTRYDDEMTACEFFTPGTWEEMRDGKIAASVAGEMERVNRQYAHLTLSRPFPEERGVYVRASHRPALEEIVALLVQFTENVDPRLIPGWWAEWFGEFADAYSDGREAIRAKSPEEDGSARSKR